MSSKIIFIGFLTLLVFSSGCAKNHRVFINPSVPIHNSDIGKGLPVAVKVIDIRPSNVISKWQGGLKVRKFTVISQGDLKDVFTAQTKQGLTKLGFSPKNFNFKTERVLKIEILNIKSHYQEKIPRMNIQVKADIKATCQNQEKRLRKIFTAKKKRFDITSATFPNEKLLNACLSEIMGKIFSDPSLITCLAE
ncbi:MAG: hypothetical protein HOI59_00875 [Nitrospina sp.]|jgi:uncharacterized lipoprotein YajG|nr:hypothetical protein [Nitrospina sp.]MBT3414192.1 hypothetical protein [Nitrospina sp.]MBT3857317.1 hypothetical protein [Nitrospina sp.]MBT4104238.1 hypothetical protein [Nitrospina sp.]MBT4389089.1 hypothetical protein [Nitrospina sp.]